MAVYISNLYSQGLSCGSMQRIPSDIGIEIFCETGNDYYWHHLLPVLLKDRSVPLSLHGPFQRLDLSDPSADFEPMREAYIWAFELGKKFGAKDCVCHPYAGHRPKDDTAEKIETAKETALNRILELNRLAEEYEIKLLVENMPETDGLLDQQAFIDLFSPRSELSFLIDTGHAHLQQWDWELAFEKLGSRILGYHINDNKGDFDSHLKVGEGTIDWEHFFKGYLQYTPQANLVLEYNFGPLEAILESVRIVRHYLKTE